MADAVQPECIVRSILARLLIRREDVDKPAGTLSGGERNKLAFAKLFASPANLLLLDEPTNYLDLPALESLQEMIKDYEGTILLVTHDRAFADGCCTRTIRLQAENFLYPAVVHPLRQSRSGLGSPWTELCWNFDWHR